MFSSSLLVAPVDICSLFFTQLLPITSFSATQLLHFVRVSTLLGSARRHKLPDLTNFLFTSLLENRQFAPNFDTGA